MSIISLDGVIAGVKQCVSLKKTGGRTTVANAWFSMFDVAGEPGAGTLAGSSTTTGTVPTDATAGCPALNNPGSGLSLYLAGIDYGNTVASRIRVCDLLWKGGAYAFNAAVSGQTPSSFSSRIPGGTDYTGLEIWVEQVTAATGNQTVNATYTDQDGNTGATTGAVGIGSAPTVGRMWQLPLAGGDSGLRGITGVAGGTASAGTFNVLVLRPLWTGRVRMANDGGVHGVRETLLPQIYGDSALFMMISADSTSAGVPELELTTVAG